MSRRILAPLLLLVLGGLLVWVVSEWARDELRVHRATPPSPGAPTLILLHGYGAAGNDLVGLGEALAPSLPGVQIIAPQGPFNLVGSGRAWYVESKGEAVESRALLTDLIDALIADGTPRHQIMVAGFSQGGTMAVDIGLFHESVGCVATLSGGVLSSAAWNAQLSRGTVPEFLIAHGRKDPTVAFSNAKTLADGLEKAGASVSFFEFGGGHEIPDEVEGRLAEFAASCLLE